MTKKSYINIVVGTGAGLMLLPLIALAQPQSAQDVINLIDKFASWFEAIIFIIAIIMIFVSAFQFLTAGGNEEKVATARKSLIWGLVGIAVALFARLAKTFVLNVLQGR